VQDSLHLQFSHSQFLQAMISSFILYIKEKASSKAGFTGARITAVK
jgi:hypothetical protein